MSRASRENGEQTYRQMMTVGFLFYGSSVLLVQKNKPSWQAGLWNGVGGKAEFGETPIQCLRREFMEEVRVDTSSNWRWRHLAVEVTETYELHAWYPSVERDVFRKFSVDEIGELNDAGEKLEFHRLGDLSSLPVIGNLRWMIPLARDWRTSHRPVVFRTSDDIRENATWTW